MHVKSLIIHAFSFQKLALYTSKNLMLLSSGGAGELPYVGE